MAIAKVKKKFFSVEIPLINKETFLIGYELRELDGKFIKYDLTRMLRGKSALARFKVSVENERAIAKPVEISILQYFTRRMVRKGTDYIEDSFSAECSDAVVIIKPLLISRRKVSRAVRKALRNKAREELTNYIKERDSENIFRGLLKGQIQKEINVKLKKIYPLSLCEVRVFKVAKFLDKSRDVKKEKKGEVLGDTEEDKEKIIKKENFKDTKNEKKTDMEKKDSKEKLKKSSEKKIKKIRIKE